MEAAARPTRKRKAAHLNLVSSDGPACGKATRKRCGESGPSLNHSKRAPSSASAYECDMPGHTHAEDTEIEGAMTAENSCDEEKEAQDNKNTRKKKEEKISEEEKAVQEMEEFYDLLSRTADRDVKTIDARLRQSVSASSVPPQGLMCKMSLKVWKMAKRLSSVNERMVRVGGKLQYLASAQNQWGKCVAAAEIAGELLRESLEQSKLDARAQKR